MYFADQSGLLILFRLPIDWGENVAEFTCLVTTGL